MRYTSTEASLGTGTVPGDPDEAVASTVGRPVPGVELVVAADGSGCGRRPDDAFAGQVAARSKALIGNDQHLLCRATDRWQMVADRSGRDRDVCRAHSNLNLYIHS